MNIYCHRYRKCIVNFKNLNILLDTDNTSNMGIIRFQK